MSATLSKVQRSDHEAAILLQGLAVDLDPAAATEVADHVPVDRGLVDAASLGIAAPDREVDGAADLLVEQDLAGPVA